ncbi:MAG TPA: hypothetical protein DCW83_07325 [Saprospirales bacterium]|jgi:hypothetical protein|nr:hypothetical protein [Saprospiraceae bacterium]MDA9625902.1 hypothetical protein [bacterium]HAW04482.1 hypothetical protein [Saprospirales bacterium]
MTNFIKSVFYLSVCIAIGTSCKEEISGTLDYSDSYGSWILSEALKEGKTTRTLDGTTFDIDTTSLTTNLFGAYKDYNYERVGSRLQLTVNGSKIFTVEKSTPDTLILSMTRRRRIFQLLMIKDINSTK